MRQRGDSLCAARLMTGRKFLHIYEVCTDRFPTASAQDAAQIFPQRRQGRSYHFGDIIDEAFRFLPAEARVRDRFAIDAFAYLLRAVLDIAFVLYRD